LNYDELLILSENIWSLKLPLFLMDCADFCWGMVKLVVVMLNSPPGGGQIRGKARFWGQPGGLGGLVF